MTPMVMYLCSDKCRETGAIGAYAPEGMGNSEGGSWNETKRSWEVEKLKAQS